MYSVKRDLSLIDVFAVYCPETDSVYYISSKDIGANTRAFNLRVGIPGNNQVKDIRVADEFKCALRIFTSY